LPVAIALSQDSSLRSESGLGQLVVVPGVSGDVTRCVCCAGAVPLVVRLAMAERVGSGSSCPCPARAASSFDVSVVRMLSRCGAERWSDLHEKALRAHLILDHPRCSVVEYIIALYRESFEHLRRSAAIEKWGIRAAFPKLWAVAMGWRSRLRVNDEAC
jgi:hypothetical protein